VSHSFNCNLNPQHTKSLARYHTEHSRSYKAYRRTRYTTVISTTSLALSPPGPAQHFIHHERTCPSSRNTPDQSDALLFIRSRDAKYHLPRRCLSNSLKVAEPVWTVPQPRNRLVPVHQHLLQSTRSGTCITSTSTIILSSTNGPHA
jgi:hypothetical protein